MIEYIVFYHYRKDPDDDYRIGQSTVERPEEIKNSDDFAELEEAIREENKFHTVLIANIMRLPI
jgi:hypothetical protein